MQHAHPTLLPFCKWSTLKETRALSSYDNTRSVGFRVWVFIYFLTLCGIWIWHISKTSAKFMIEVWVKYLAHFQNFCQVHDWSLSKILHCNKSGQFITLLITNCLFLIFLDWWRKEYLEVGFRSQSLVWNFFLSGIEGELSHSFECMLWWVIR
jgi:hypothetical protein